MWEKVKIAVMVLVCMGMFLDLSILSRAAENRVCEGGCVTEILAEGERYVSNGGVTHTRIQWQKTKCLICGTERTEQAETSESCGWTKYTDLGHQTDQNHRYRISCGKCGYSQEITITTCRAEWTGKHETPL